MANRGLKILLTFVATFFVTSLCFAQVNPYNRQLRSTKRIVIGGQFEKIDSAAIFRRDSIRVMQLADSLRTLPSEELINVSDSLRLALPDSLQKAIFTDEVWGHKRDSIARAEKLRLKAEKRDGKEPFISDSMSLRRVSTLSAVLPGFGQIYNKQYWKLPILYTTVGASAGMWIHQSNKYKPLKEQFELMTDQGLQRTEEMNALQRDMIKHNTLKQAFMFTTIASYIYFIGDAAINYSTNEVSSVNKATTLSTICPGAGQIYNKSYWRVPIIIGGLASTIYTIDWNNRGYKRFKTAYALRVDYDKNPDKYPGGAADEFRGAYSATFLKNLKDSYRRNRDLCILLTAGVYMLQIIDAHVDAHLQDYDISDDLTMNLEPYFDYLPVGSTPLVGVNMSLKF